MKTATSDISPAAERRSVDPNGNVLLIAGAASKKRQESDQGDPSPLTTYEILVSSKVLSVASNVFASMFSRKFGEGARLTAAESSSSSLPTPIHLAEDSAEATWKLCMILHHKCYEANDFRSIEAFGSVLEVAHKYNCAQALCFLGELILQNHISKAGLQSYEKLLGIAFMLEHKRLFTDITRSFILTYSGDFSVQAKLKMQFGSIPVPDSLISK